jgi:hypothetical protein
MANDPGFDLTPVSYNPFGFDDQLNGWMMGANAAVQQARDLSGQTPAVAAAQRARDLAAERLRHGVMGQQQPQPRE